MPMRSIWSGSLSFGLINIPVKLYSASESTGLDFRMLEKHGLCPIGYVRVCRHDNREVPYEEIVKGYEYRKGDFVVIEDEDFEKASPKKTKTIDVVNFTNSSEIEEKFYEKPYFIEPDENAEKAYVLLREALARSGKTAIARFVLRNKEHLAAIKPEGEILVLHQMRFAQQLREPEELRIPEGINFSEPEINMALQLIDQLTEHFKAEKYKDTYTEQLKDIIEDKAKGKTPQKKDGEPGPPTTEMEEIMNALRKSLKKPREKA